MWEDFRDYLPASFEQMQPEVWRSLTDEVAATALVLFIAVVLYLLVTRVLLRIGHRSHLDASMVFTLRAIVRWLFCIFTLASVLQVWHMLDQFWAAATAFVTLVAVGFVAVWSVLSNVLCSIILLATRPFRIGQHLELPPDSLSGTVEEVGLIHTTLRDADGSELLIPNNLFFQRIVRVRVDTPHPMTRANESDHR